MPFAGEKKAKPKPVERTPPCQYSTVEELRAAVLEGLEDIKAGRTISHEDLEKWVDSLAEAPCQYSVEQMRERVDLSMENLRAGNVVTLETLRAKHPAR